MATIACNAYHCRSAHFPAGNSSCTYNTEITCIYLATQWKRAALISLSKSNNKTNKHYLQRNTVLQRTVFTVAFASTLILCYDLRD